MGERPVCACAWRERGETGEEREREREGGECCGLLVLS
jgi:hypothetical protein